ncbi:MAG TPA: Crp/Fnr family transcriptional regulator [Mucilaginibacter sp.]|jgi:CRP-like cAMP-binding protein|nr:Crp/Fnr family transcriptional regulator [Mucilaginibacter sp.]
MDNQTVAAYIKNVSPNISDGDIPLLVSCAANRELKRGELILKEGEVCRSFYLVETGYLRTYYNKDGIAINLNFTFEGDFVSSLKSLRGHKPSEVVIEAGEDTSVWIFNLDVIMDQFNADPAIVLFIRRLMAHLLVASEEQGHFFKLYTPTERYRYIEKNNPRLLQRVSLSQMASYLGVTRETLSRIRAKNN